MKDKMKDETGGEVKDNAIMKFEVYECARGGM